MAYHKLIFDSSCEDIITVDDYEEVDDFDPACLWGGEAWNSSAKLEDHIQLLVDSEDETLHKADLLPNPVSWWIFSNRLLDAVLPLIKNDVQVLMLHFINDPMAAK